MADTYTAAASSLTGNFLTQVQATCAAQASTIMVCDMSDITIKRCNINLTCDNTGSVNTYTCSPSQVVAAILAAAGQTTIPPDAAANIATLTKNFQFPQGVGVPPGTDPVSQAMAQYIATRCNESVIAAQAVSLPRFDATDCKQDNITLLNQLDASVRCSVSAISELIPADPLPTPYPTPLWKEPLQLSLVLGGAVLLMALAAFLISCGVLKIRAVRKLKNGRAAQTPRPPPPAPAAAPPVSALSAAPAAAPAAAPGALPPS
jgi:hypothetical protein